MALKGNTSRRSEVAVIVVGGHSHNIGKSTVVAGLIAALPEFAWTAIKISRYDPGICPLNGSDCGCARAEHPFKIEEEQDRQAHTDSSRFLAAGASRAFWARVKYGQFAAAMEELRPIIRSGSNSIIESNSILGYLKPELYLVVLRYDVADWKASARAFLERADAAVLTGDSASEPQWKGIRDPVPAGLPAFPYPAPGPLPDGLVALVRFRLTRSEPQR
jgi:hypothetical protein